MDYLKIYNRIIAKAKLEGRKKLPRDHSDYIYYEAHHIIPRCMSGDGHKSMWKTHDNIVLLTAREHFLCHWILNTIFPDNNRLFYAFRMMCVTGFHNSDRFYPSSRIIEYARIEFSKRISKRLISDEERKNRSKAQTGLKRPSVAGDKNPSKRSEVREKISKSNIGRKSTPASIEKNRLKSLGKTNIQMYGKEKALECSIKKSNSLKLSYLNDPTLPKRKSESMKGKNTNLQATYSCPYCGKTGGISTMKSRHLPICKSAQTANS